MIPGCSKDDYFLLSFFNCFSARFSFKVFKGFFLSSFRLSSVFAIVLIGLHNISKRVNKFQIDIIATNNRNSFPRLGRAPGALDDSSFSRQTTHLIVHLDTMARPATHSPSVINRKSLTGLNDHS